MLTTITLSPDPVAFTGLGEEVTLTATALDQNRNILAGVTLAWTSNDPTVASVVAGVVTAVADGEATITVSSGGVTASVPVTVHVWAAVSAGGRHTCGLAPTGAVYCWGDNEHGQLGQDATSLFEANEPLLVPGSPTFVSISAGHEHACGVTAGAEAFCWGNNESGQLGDRTNAARREVPVPVFGQLQYQSVVAGAVHSCGLTTAGAAYCWGGPNIVGYLGDGTALGSNSPVPVAGGHSFTSIAVGHEHSCGLTDASTAYCWGNNNRGQLGIGSVGGFRATPVLAAGGAVLDALAAAGNHTCGLTPAGVVQCWGRNNSGQVGSGAGPSTGVPFTVTAVSPFQFLVAGEETTCAWTTVGAASCWGLNDAGQLGDGATVSSGVPRPVVGNLVFEAVSAGGHHGCGLTVAQAVYCWGDNQLGRLGTGDNQSTATPSRVSDR